MWLDLDGSMVRGEAFGEANRWGAGAGFGQVDRSEAFRLDTHRQSFSDGGIDQLHQPATGVDRTGGCIGLDTSPCQLHSGIHPGNHNQEPSDRPNTDGIDVTGCQEVAISDCFIDTGDVQSA